jgi:hypothetical protein
MDLICYFSSSMKLAACILMLATLSYWAETLWLPSKIGGIQGTCKATGDRCCRKIQATACGGSQEKSSPSKNAPCKDCGNTASCINCPLCYMATAVDGYLSGILFVPHHSTYPSMADRRLSDYYGRSWKPPNSVPRSTERIIS